MPVTALTREIIQGMIGQDYTGCDFANLVEAEAKAAGLKLSRESIKVSDGLEPTK